MFLFFFGTRLWQLVQMLIGGIRYSGKANNQTKNKIEITRFTSITVWGSDRVRHNCASNKVTNDYWTIFSLATLLVTDWLIDWLID